MKGVIATEEQFFQIFPLSCIHADLGLPQFYLPVSLSDAQKTIESSPALSKCSRNLNIADLFSRLVFTLLLILYFLPQVFFYLFFVFLFILNPIFSPLFIVSLSTPINNPLLLAIITSSSAQAFLYAPPVLIFTLLIFITILCSCKLYNIASLFVVLINLQ